MIRPMVAAFDLLTCLLLMFVIMALTDKPPRPPHIVTPGILAITDTWAAGSNDDVDIYVRAPNGNVLFFANRSVGLMHLEQDDLGTAMTGTTILPDGRKVVSTYNGERVVMTGAEPGEYTVNVQMYKKNDPGVTPVMVQLWLLRGGDRVLLSQRVVLSNTGDERTAFRFTLNSAGNVTAHNRIPATLVKLALGGPS